MGLAQAWGSFSWLELKPIPAEIEIIKGMSRRQLDKLCSISIFKSEKSCAKLINYPGCTLKGNAIVALFHVSNFSLFVSVQVLTRLQKQREKNYF